MILELLSDLKCWRTDVTCLLYLLMLAHKRIFLAWTTERAPLWATQLNLTEECLPLERKIFGFQQRTGSFCAKWDSVWNKLEQNGEKIKLSC